MDDPVGSHVVLPKLVLIFEGRCASVGLLLCALQVLRGFVGHLTCGQLRCLAEDTDDDNLALGSDQCHTRSWECWILCTFGVTVVGW